MYSVFTKANLAGLKAFLKDEDGDTNFISIIIILGLVIVLVGIFVAFKDKIVGTISEVVNGFSKNSLGKDKTQVLTDG